MAAVLLLPFSIFLPVARSFPFLAALPPPLRTTTGSTRQSFASILLLHESKQSSSSVQKDDAPVGSSTAAGTTTSAAASFPKKRQLEPDQLEFVLGYLNKHHSDVLKVFAEAFSPLGLEMLRANTASGGYMKVEEARAVNIDTEQMELAVDIQIRGKPLETRKVQFALRGEPTGSRRKYQDAVAAVPEDPNRLPIDDIVRRLCRLCWIIKRGDITGKLIQLAVQLKGAGIGKLPENMYLNQVPHNRYVRQYFYDQVSEAVMEAVIKCSQGELSNRMKVTSQFPEMNPSMDSYRIGTILEMVRAIAIRLAEENLRVRVCVQGSMGVGIFTGVPKQLNGVSRLVQMMDWQSGEGEENEGMVGEYVRFGAVGPEHVINTIKDSDGNIVQHQDDAFIIIAPQVSCHRDVVFNPSNQAPLASQLYVLFYTLHHHQNMVGTDSSIIPLLEEMVAAAGDRPVIIINPDLTDKVSAAGQQSFRGRQGRIDFANSFETVYHFQNIYVSGTSYFPILGAFTKMRPSEPWIAHQRRDYADGDGEIYLPVLAAETKPEGTDIMESFEKQINL